MNKNIIRTAAAITSAVMVLAMAAGCKNDDTEDRDGLSEFVYIAETIPLLGDTREFAYFDGKLYFTSVKTENATEENPYVSFTSSELYSINIDGTGLAKLANYTPSVERPEGAGGWVNIPQLVFDDEGNLWVVEEWSLFSYDLPEDFDIENFEYDELWQYEQINESGITVRKLDSTGAEILRADLGGIRERQELLHVTAFAVGVEALYVGIMDLTDSNPNSMSIYVADMLGNVQFMLKADDYFEQFAAMPDGSVALVTFVNDERNNLVPGLLPINLATKALGEAVLIPIPGGLSIGLSGFPRVFRGAGGYDILVNDSVDVHGFSLGEDEAEKLFSWIDVNAVVNTIKEVIMLPDGCIVCVNALWDFDAQSSRSELLVLAKTPRSEMPAAVLMLATLSELPIALSKAVAEFNAANLDYRIEVVDYSLYNTGDDSDAGLMRLTTEIISGKAPDMLLTSGIPLADYAARGLLTDLYPYIDADPELSRSDILQAALRTAETDGCLYIVFSDFCIDTSFGHPSVVGPGTGWNIDEFQAVLDACPNADIPLGYWVTKEYFLEWTVAMGMEEYIDWDAGTVRFDSPEFIRLLELCDRLPDNPEDGAHQWQLPASENLLTGRQIMVQTMIQDFRLAPYYSLLVGGEIAYKGFPTENRAGSILFPVDGLAITEASQNKDAAWLFARTILDKDRQLDNLGLAFPTNQAAFDQRAQEATERQPDIAIAVTNPDGSGKPLVLDPPQREEVDALVVLINTATSGAYWNRDEALLAIIKEGAADYFNGTATAQDAARVIQSRASIYVSERK